MGISIVTPDTDATRYDFAGQEGRLLEDGERTHGAFAASSWTLAPGGYAPPLHRHREIDEAIYVLSGTLELGDGEGSRTAPAGTFAAIPAGTGHTMSVVGDEPVRMLIVMSTPRRAVETFEALSAAFAGGPPAPERMAELLAGVDLEPAGAPA
jgi:quercetin dioxygenase-like cupin family protein